MSEIDWRAIRADYEDGLSLRKLAAKYGISKSVIGDRKYSEKWDQRRTDARTDKSNPNPPTRDINAAVRVQIALKLRIEEHLTWDEVAARAGYGSRGTAHHAVMRELDRCITHDVKELRDQELYMLSRLQARAYKVGIDENNKDWTWAVDRFVALSKRKSELMGLDTPIDAAQNSNVVLIREVPAGLLAEGPTP